MSITQAHLEHAKIPPKYWNVLLKKIPNDMPYKKDVKTYLANLETFLKDGIGLYLWSGENSTGKSAISVLCGKRAMELKYTTLFITAEDFKNALIENAHFDDQETIYRRAVSVDLLILDDLGKEYRPNKEGVKQGFAESKIQSLLRWRTQHNLTTIFTSNQHPKELKNIYSKDLSEMLRASMKPIEVKGMNWRAQEEKKINQMFEELGE